MKNRSRSLIFVLIIITVVSILAYLKYSKVTVSISSNPSNAAVFVDGTIKGHTPISIKLKPGKHNFKITEVGYKDHASDVIVERNLENKISFSLEKVSLIWKYPIDLSSSSEYTYPLTIYNGKIYATFYNCIYCLDADTGNLEWNYCIADPANFTNSSIIYDERIFAQASNSSEDIYCIDIRTGKLIWKHQTENLVFSSIAVSDGKVYYNDFDNVLYCLDANTGNLVWKQKIYFPPSYNFFHFSDSNSLVIYKDKIYGYTDEFIYCIPIEH